MKRWIWIGLAAIMLVSVIYWIGTFMQGPKDATGNPVTEPDVRPEAENSPDRTHPDLTEHIPGGGSSVETLPPAGGKPSDTQRNEAAGTELSDPDAVTVTFAGDKRLKAPATTLVAPSPQNLYLKFKQPMDRDSVIGAILMNNAGMRGQENVKGEQKYVFYWRGDTELTAELKLAEDDYKEGLGRSYAVNVDGAKTKQGQVLRNQPGIRVVVTLPEQMWRLSADGSKAEPVTAFSEPYGMSLLDSQGRYLMLTRPTQYCECDAFSVPLYSIYDTAARTISDYPFRLFLNYEGEGSFVADRRGFFYADPQGAGVPERSDTVPIKLQGYVHGAAFSRDGKTVAAAVGKDESQIEDLDLVLIDLTNGKERRFRGVLAGRLEMNQVSDGTLPVTFYDDGKRLYMSMWKKEPYEEIPYQFDWRTGEFKIWKAPAEAAAWSGFTASADGEYRMYANAGLYKGEEKLSDIPLGMTGYPAYWLGGGHTLVYTGYEPGDRNEWISHHLYATDAVSGQKSILFRDIPQNSRLIGASPDGKWLFLVTSSVIKPGK